MEYIEIQNSKVTARIALQIGNNLYSLTVEDREILYFPYSLDDFRNNSSLAGNPIMHPWVNRIKEGRYVWSQKVIDTCPYSRHLLYDQWQQPLHGLMLKSSQWDIVDKGDDFVITRTQWNESLPYFEAFPFAHTLTVSYYLNHDGIIISQDITNEGVADMPVSTGFHPYFSYPYEHRKDIKFDFGFSYYLITDEQLIPTGEIADVTQIPLYKGISLEDLHLDHGFIATGSEIKISMPDYLMILESRAYPFWVVYTPDHPKKPYFCIEPITSPTDGFNLNNTHPLLCSLPIIRCGENYTTNFVIAIKDTRK